MSVQPILLDGEWVASASSKTFTAINPATNEQATPEVYPVSTWEECDAACDAAHRASVAMRGWPGERFARYLEAFATRAWAWVPSIYLARSARLAPASILRSSTVSPPPRAPPLHFHA
jgi:alpha-ketoglutaric semialdehyde dehydrogenase